MKKRGEGIALALLFVCFTFFPALAQDADIELKAGETLVMPGADPVSRAADAMIADAKDAKTPEEINKLVERIQINSQTTPSLFFTDNQYSLLQEARQGLLARIPDEGESMEGELGPEEQEAPQPGLRELTLAGIVFIAENEWTIWLNGQRVTPSAIPKEVLDLKVNKGYVDIKWFDEFTNRIYPIRLRPHQRFNLDSKIFLPG